MNYLLNNYPEASTIPLDRDIISGGDPYYGKEDDVKNFKMEYYLAGPLDKYKDISKKMETEILDEMYVKNIEEEFENFVFEGNQENNNSARWIKYVTPKGRITIYDPITKTYIPSGSVRICIYNFAHGVILTTNSDGTFSSPLKFEKGWWGTPKIKIYFENDYCNLKSMGSMFILTDYYEGGSINWDNFEKINIQIKDKKAVNGINITRITEGMTKAKFIDFVKPKLNMWYINSKDSIQTAFTSLLGLGCNTGFATPAYAYDVIKSYTNDFLGVSVATLVALLDPLLTFAAPDFVFINWPDCSTMDGFSESCGVVIHELCHLKHYQMIGKNNNKGAAWSSWNKVCRYYSSNPNNPNRGDEGLSSAIESFATFYGTIYNYELNEYFRNQSGYPGNYLNMAFKTQYQKDLQYVENYLTTGLLSPSDAMRKTYNTKVINITDDQVREKFYSLDKANYIMACLYSGHTGNYSSNTAGRLMNVLYNNGIEESKITEAFYKEGSNSGFFCIASDEEWIDYMIDNEYLSKDDFNNKFRYEGYKMKYKDPVGSKLKNSSKTKYCLSNKDKNYYYFTDPFSLMIYSTSRSKTSNQFVYGERN